MSWETLPHGPIQKMEGNLWRVEGEMAHMPMRRAMDLVRRPNGEVWIHNAVALNEPSMAEIEAWGKPSVLLVPSGYHRIDPARFKERYPDLRVYCPKNATRGVSEKVKVDGSYDDLRATLGDATDVAIEHLDGVNDVEGVVRVTSDGGVSLLLCDAVFNMKHRPGPKGFVLRLIGSSGGPRVTNLFRFAVLKDKAAFRACLRRLADTPNLKRVLVQHEDVMDPGAFRALAAAF